jgi:hypothetical protein
LSEGFFAVTMRHEDECRKSYALLRTPPMWRFEFKIAAMEKKIEETG